MKRATSILVILLLGLITLARAQSTEPKNLFFVMDVSGSMEKSKIFQPLKNEITKYIQNEANKGDFVSIITFGTDVKLIASQRISPENTATDIALLVEKINKLKANEQYTHLTSALDLLASQMGLVKTANPASMVKAFLFTDGKNEPPPGAEGANWTFEQILKKHYDVFDNPATYLFVITLGIQPDEGLIQAAKERKDKIFINSVPDVSKLEGANIIPKEVPKQKPIIEPKPSPIVEPKVRLDFSGPSKITTKAKSRYDLIVSVKDYNQEAIGKILSVAITINPQTDISYSEKKFEIKERTKVKIPIFLNKPNPGNYTVRVGVISKEAVNISPSDFTKNFIINKPNYAPLIVLLIVIALAICGWAFVRSIPKFTDDHGVVNTKEGLTYELRERQKWYSSKVTSKDLEISDAEFSLKMNRKTGEIFCRVLIDGEWTDKIIQSGEMIVDPYKFNIRMI